MRRRRWASSCSPRSPTTSAWACPAPQVRDLLCLWYCECRNADCVCFCAEMRLVVRLGEISLGDLLHLRKHCCPCGCVRLCPQGRFHQLLPLVYLCPRNLCTTVTSAAGASAAPAVVSILVSKNAGRYDTSAISQSKSFQARLWRLLFCRILCCLHQ
jgi:hypothetical protein